MRILATFWLINLSSQSSKEDRFNRICHPQTCMKCDKYVAKFAYRKDNRKLTRIVTNGSEISLNDIENFSLLFANYNLYDKIARLHEAFRAILPLDKCFSLYFFVHI